MSDIIVDKECSCLLDINTKNCQNCRNAAGNFTCHGCCRHFCPEHVREHRRVLDENLAALINQNQRLDTSVGGGHRQQECQRALEELARWEEESIRKVHAAAEDVRRKLAKISGENETSQLKQLTVCRERFTHRLQEAQTRNNYHERHLKYWAQFFEDLQENFKRLRGGYVRLIPCGNIVEKLCIDERTVGIRFSKWCEYKETCLQVVDIRRTGEYRDGDCTQPIHIRPCTDASPRPRSPVPRPRSPSPVPRPRSPVPRPRSPSPPPVYIPSRPRPRPRTPTPPRPRTPTPPRPRTPTPPRPRTPTPPPVKICPQEQQTTEYRFCIFDDHRFVGIISKHEGNADSPLNTPSVYGWSTTDEIYRDGFCQSGNDNDLRRGDVVSLVVSSSEKKIQLKNLTRARTHELSIDVQKCPMPWQLKIVRATESYH